MKKLYVIFLFFLIFNSCSDPLIFDRENPNDPKSENFEVTSPETPSLEYDMTNDGFFEIHYHSKKYYTATTIKKKYSEEHEFITLVDEATSALFFSDTTKFFTQGTIYSVAFYNSDNEGQRFYSKDTVIAQMQFVPFRNFRLKYDQANISIEGYLPRFSNDSESLVYFDGVRVSYRLDDNDSWKELLIVHFKEFAIRVSSSLFFSKSVAYQAPATSYELKAEQFIRSSIGDEFILASTQGILK